MRKPTFEGEVLLCEDNDMNRQVACEHFARVGLKTVVAENGKIGVELVNARKNKREKQFDLIFMDMHMPVMDGLEAAAKIQAMETGIPIIAMTANVMTDDKEQYAAGGMNDYLGKPFTSQELWRCLVKYLEPVKWQSEDETRLEESDNELRLKLIKNFVKNNKNKYGEIEKAIKEDDIKLAHRLVHTLKSNAGQLKKTSLSLAAEEVENALKNNMNLSTAKQMETLKMELDAVIIELTPVAEEMELTTVINEQPETADVIRILDELELLLKDNDFDCLSYVKSLQSIPGSGDLIRHIESFDSIPALEALNKLKEKFTD